MGRTIDLDAAIDALHMRFSDGFVEDRWWNSTHVLDVLRSVPSVQPEIVRCKDCILHGVCTYERGLGKDGFCSQGRRAEDA